MLGQRSRAATVFTREGKSWCARVFVGDAVIDMPETGITLRLDQACCNMSFTPAEA